MRRTGTSRAATLLAVVVPCLVLSGAVVFGARSPRSAPGKFDQSSMDGSRQAVMQPVSVGVRMGQLAYTSGSQEQWGFGLSMAKVAAWPGSSGQGQTVFMHYRPSSGWRFEGPPVDESGALVNPKLTSISMAGDNNGWAVGDRGAMLRLDENRWVQARSVTSSSLRSVSIRSDGGSTYGFAVGDGQTVLRLSEGRWVQDDLDVPRGETWNLLAVATAGPEEAWVAGSDGGATLILRRTPQGWSRIRTDQALFDERSPRTEGGVTILSAAGSAATATSDVGWIGGTIAPVDTTSSLGDPAGDSTRPFAIRIRGDSITTFCPDRYSIGSDRKAVTTPLCDEPFPMSGFGISAIQAIPGNRDEVMAGGLGLFHFRGGSWFREPNIVGYVASLSFSSPTEGWVAGTGNTFGGTSSVSSIQTLGHWTDSPKTPRLARWPEPVTDEQTLSTHPLEAVAVAPDSSGRALAVGSKGASLLFRPGVGWDSLQRATPFSLHGLAWPTPSVAWAVGDQGTILRYEGGVWKEAPGSRILTTATLYGVAFSSAERGYAVGSNGIILTFSAGRWSVDRASSKLTRNNLYAVTNAGSEFIAVGDNATIANNRDGNWRMDDVSKLVSRGGRNPTLYTIDGLSDGTVFAGGELSTLLRRDGRGESWRLDVEGRRVPPEGTILALSARRSSGSTELFVSLSREQSKFTGSIPAAVTGYLMRGNSDGWHDVSYDAKVTANPSMDASSVPDPIYGIALEGPGAWAVGGTGSGANDGRGHAQAYPTSSIYRFEPRADPRPIGNKVIPTLDPDPDLINFAFFGESSCGKGLCSVPMGTGTKADEVALRIQDEIETMARVPGGPRFVIFGGNMRGTGMPEELGEFKRYADGFGIPFFASLGKNDLFSVIRSDLVDPAGSTGFGGISVPGPTDDLFYVNIFEDRPAPWGRRRVPKIQPVSIGAQPPSGARTHYAFDYVDSPSRRLRVIVLDDSVIGRVTDSSTQNPPQDQQAWLNEVLSDARSKDLASIIVMNRPAKDPLDVSNPDTHAEAVPIQNLAAQVGASAVFTSYYRENAVDLLKLPNVQGTVPVYVFGGGGAPLKSRVGHPPEPSTGYYHSWQLVSVNLEEASRERNAFRSAEVYVRSFPVLDQVALHAIDGTTVPGGNTLRFTGSGRAPDGGGPGDPLQSKAVVVPLDFSSRGVCAPDYQDKNRPKCSTTAGGPVGPSYQYVSENLSIGYFVRPNPLNEREPLLDATTGSPVPDTSSGLFCSVGTGTTYVSIISGVHRARMEVSVTPGRGPCVKSPVLGSDPLPRAAEGILTVPLARSAFQTFLGPPLGELQVFGLVPPPAVPIVAPAPPAAGGYARKEEHEEAKEVEGQSFKALPRAQQGGSAISRTSGKLELTDDPMAFVFAAAFLTTLAAVAGISLIFGKSSARASSGSYYRRRKSL